jgi:hypothetical protein
MAPSLLVISCALNFVIRFFQFLIGHQGPTYFPTARHCHRFSL